MSDKLVTIAHFADSIEAEMAKQVLEDFGIRSIISGQNAANVYSGVSAIAEVTLQTFESDAKQALEILESNSEKEQ